MPAGRVRLKADTTVGRYSESPVKKRGGVVTPPFCKLT
jgi:hypothetical protein